MKRCWEHPKGHESRVNSLVTLQRAGTCKNSRSFFHPSLALSPLIFSFFFLYIRLARPLFPSILDLGISGDPSSSLRGWGCSNLAIALSVSMQDVWDSTVIGIYTCVSYHSLIIFNRRMRQTFRAATSFSRNVISSNRCFAEMQFRRIFVWPKKKLPKVIWPNRHMAESSISEECHNAERHYSE